jgi:hypothetical protein
MIVRVTKFGRFRAIEVEKVKDCPEASEKARIEPEEWLSADDSTVKDWQEKEAVLSGGSD